MKLLACGAALVFASSAVSAQVLEATAVWSSGIGANGHEYRLYSISSGITWDNAEMFAMSLGGTLATITSVEENTFVYDMLSIGTNNNVWHVDQFNSRIGPWLGGYEITEGQWAWVTGEPFAYSNFAPGEPNNSGGTENRIHFFGNPNRSSAWNDITNSVPIEGFVVELVPTPGAAGLLAAFGLLISRRRR